MGEPYTLRCIIYIRRKPAELKYLSKLGKEINRDSESSDERNWNSLNPYGAKGEPVAVRGLYDVLPQSSNSDTYLHFQENGIERPTKEGSSPVSERTCKPGTIHS